MNNKDNKHDLLLTSKEAAAELKVSESFLAKARMRGTGPAFIQIGRAVRYSRSALETYKSLQTRISTSQQQMLSCSAPRTYRQGSSNSSPSRAGMISNHYPSLYSSIHVDTTKLGSCIRVTVANILLTLSQNIS